MAITGMSASDVELAPYDAAWAEDYRQEEAMLKELLGDEAIHIDHIGSTSIPGMAAKPLIDIMVQTNSGDITENAARKLEENGYRKKIFPDRKQFMYMKGPDECRTHNIHFAEAGSVFATSMLVFRDKLRADKNLAQQYFELKSDLANAHPNERSKYYEGKIKFFQHVLGIQDRYPGQ